MEPNNNLVAIEPTEALNKYLMHRQNEVSEKTLESHKYRLQHFIRWCEKNEIESLDKLSPRDLQDYRYWREQDGDLNAVSLHTQMTTFRVFLKWAEDYQAVPSEFNERVRVPKLPRDANARDETISPERADRILTYLKKYEYASQRHTLFSVLWHTGMRIGGARSLDLKDFNEKEKYLEVHHRPETETPLKNGKNGERPVSISTKIRDLLSDFIEARRHNVTDSHGREPLFTTQHGRPALTTLRGRVYWISRPCKYRDGYCPHGREEADCEAAQKLDTASKCPSSFSPHTVRRSSITYWLLQDAPEEAVKEALSDRMNANKEVIDYHYDKRTPNEKMEQRRRFFEE